MIKGNGLTQKQKGYKNLYPAKIMTDEYHADDLALLKNTLAEAESPLQSLKQAEGNIAFYVKTVFNYLKQEYAISTLSGKPLKLVDPFTYLVRNISSTESDVNIHLTKKRAALNGSSIISIVD